MNLLKLRAGNDFIELRVTRYEFPKQNSDWLMLYGRVSVDGVIIYGEDPTVEVYEIELIREWAQKVLKEKRSNKVEMTEPNLWFKYKGDTNKLSISFYPEHTGYEINKKIPHITFKKSCYDSDLKAIIRWCDEVSNEFPTREK